MEGLKRGELDLTSSRVTHKAVWYFIFLPACGMDMAFMSRWCICFPYSNHLSSQTWRNNSITGSGMFCIRWHHMQPTRKSGSKGCFMSLAGSHKWRMETSPVWALPFCFARSHGTVLGVQQGRLTVLQQRLWMYCVGKSWTGSGVDEEFKRGMIDMNVMKN